MPTVAALMICNNALPNHANEIERLEALRALRLLDTPAEQRFDRITALAAHLFEVPIALISLVDEHRQWFKSSVGIQISETDRSLSFCSHALLGAGILMVPDATRDVRFQQNPFVTGEPFIRFYAGRPLRAGGGQRVGTLCVIGPAPRILNERELDLLDRLAELAESEINAVSIQWAHDRLRSLEVERDEQSRMFESFMDHVPGLVYIKDDQSRLQYINRQMERSFNVTGDQVLGKAEHDWLPREITAQHRENDCRVLATGDTIEEIETAPDPRGEMREWLSLKFPIRRSNGERMIGGVSIDVTEKRAAERELKKVMALHRGILDAANCSIIAVDLSGTIVTFNKTAEDWLGYKAEELVGIASASIFHLPSELVQRAIDLTVEFGRPVATGEVFTIYALEGRCVEQVWTHVRKDGSRYITGLTVSPLRDEAGAITGFIGVGRDITQEKEMQWALCQAKESAEQARAAAEQANQMKSRFLANMSHEIRTPLNGILGITNMLLDSPLTQEQQQLARTVRGSGEALLYILNDILDFSKVEAGMIELEDVDYDIAALLAETQQLYAMPACGKGLVIEADSSSGATQWLRGDPVRMRQILGNLVSNAIKFSEKGSVRISVESLPHGAPHPERIRISVTDNGIGIPSKVQTQIFAPFQQADTSTTRKFGGTGLGLAISKYLVELMGGTIAVQSRWGHGATFSFDIPFRPGKPPVVATSDDRLLSTIPVGLKVLVAEDSSVNQIVIRHELEMIGCVVEVVANGRDAVAAYHRETRDLILMDCQMPEMDGFEATAAIRQQEEPAAHVPIVAITANPLKEERDRCLAAGMDHFITKPFSREKLRSTIGEVCRQAGIVREPSLQTEELTAILDGAGELRSSLISNLQREFEAEMIATLGAFHPQDGDAGMEAIARAAHKLCGSSATVGARKLSNLCRELSAKAKAADCTAVPSLVEAVRGEAERVNSELAALH